LNKLPVEISNLDKLQVINLKNTPNVKIPDEIENKKGLHIFR
jgi:Leucine-rich repeat (LRR) protein